MWWRAIPRRRRIASVVVARSSCWSVISVLLARFLSAENVERDDILAVLQAQAHGNAAARCSRCWTAVARSPSCAATVRASAA